MTIHDDTALQIKDLLSLKFSPIKIHVNNDSKNHEGHKEALMHPKAGHFSVMLVSDLFEGKSLVERHRMVYKELASLMDSRIHALSLDLKTSKDVNA